MTQTKRQKAERPPVLLKDGDRVRLRGRGASTGEIVVIVTPLLKSGAPMLDGKGRPVRWIITAWDWESCIDPNRETTLMCSVTDVDPE